MTRTTLRIDETVLNQLKTIATAERRSLAALVDELLREAVLRHTRTRRQKSPPLPIYGSGGPAPGVDLSSTRSLLEHAEGDLPLEKRG